MSVANLLKVDKTLTFRLRKNIHGNINFIDIEVNSVDYCNMYDVKKYISEKYGNNKLTDWSVDIE